MLFLDIISWEPEKAELIQENYMKYSYPEGIRMIDEWIDLTGGRIFVIYEAKDEQAYLKANLPFMGLCKFESIPVMRADAYMEAMKAYAPAEMEQKRETEQKSKIQEDLEKQIEKLEKRLKRLEQHSYIQEEDIT